MTLCFTILIGELVLAYGTNTNFQQISINTLFVTAFLALGYTFCAVVNMETKSLVFVGSCMGVILAIFEVVYYGWRGRQIMSMINDAINN